MSKSIIDQINQISKRILDLQEVKDLQVNKDEEAEKDRAISRTKENLIKEIRNLNYFISQGQGSEYENKYIEINTALPDDIPKIISPQSIINENENENENEIKKWEAAAREASAQQEAAAREAEAARQEAAAREAEAREAAARLEEAAMREAEEAREKKDDALWKIAPVAMGQKNQNEAAKKKPPYSKKENQAKKAASRAEAETEEQISKPKKTREEIENNPDVINRYKEKITKNCGEAAGSNETPDDMQVALSILGIPGAVKDFVAEAEAEGILQEAYNAKKLLCVNDNSQKYASDKYDNYKKNIDFAYIRIGNQVKQSKLNAEALANSERKNLGIGKKKDETKARQEAARQEADTKNTQQDLSSDASVETTQIGTVISPIISANLGSNSPTASDIVSDLTNSLRGSFSSTRSNLSTAGDSVSPLSSQAGSFSLNDPSQGTGTGTGTATGPEITEIEFNNAIVAIKQLFNMKTINDLKLSNVTIKRDNLLKIITENEPQDNDNDKITNIISNAFNFYNLAHNRRSSIPLTEIRTFRDYIRYDYMDDTSKQSLKQIYDDFYEEYKKLGFSNSNIYLKPRLNNIGTRKNQSNILCDKISQLIQPMYSNRTIPSQIPNLTKLNVTKRATKLANIKKTEDAAAKKTEDETIKAQEDKKNKINKSIDAAKKTAKEREIGLIEAKIAQLTGDLEIAADLSQIRNINKEIAKLEKSLERGVKGGTRKRIKQISNIRKKKETRKR
jgi:hypothetical protein